MNNEKIEICKTTIVDYDKVNQVRCELPDNEFSLQMTSLFKTLDDPNRLKIMMALAKEELCVCDLAALLDVSVSAVSHQLRLLRTARLVKYHKEGKMVYYSLDEEHVKMIMDMAQTHFKEL
ncbi:MAG: metalloregulator ArsR/SmtB family transcription factor [Calditrichia bacterium]